ncbi:hypothetical protein HELRODRAFT_152989, partial [Helobdella robusta]|uniref:CCHC-type domain-containing protein n=1 Tax=Helobdella robusta TaxID=6412 RepID=T1EKY5_HELRO
CWICGEKGHLRRDCKHRLKDNYRRNCETRWRKRREDDPVSRSAPSNQKVVVKREPQQHDVPQCWICGEKGHLSRDCKHRLKDNYCRNCATRWRKRRE